METNSIAVTAMNIREKSGNKIRKMNAEYNRKFATFMVFLKSWRIVFIAIVYILLSVQSHHLVIKRITVIDIKTELHSCP